MTNAVNHFQFPTSVQNPNLPVLRGYRATIADDTRTQALFSAVDMRLTYAPGGTFDGLVSLVANRKSGSVETLAQAIIGAQPSYDRDGGPNGRGAFRFFTSGDDALTASAPFPVGGDFFKAVVFKSGAVTTNEYLMYSGTDGDRHMLQLGVDNSVRMRCGASGSEATAVASFVPDQWTLVIGTWNAATKTVGLSVNGADFVTDSNAGAVVDVATNIISDGSLNDVDVSDIAYGSADLSLPEHADLRAEIESYARNVLGLTIT
ncbi:hypothetical protein [uncultured Tateyamaria sp.]|uniref:hypothetical protein n=1 Tax=uncultured Tateyamaria sp. TaxID=455651 RepID=UPI00260CC83C|nr:hypothetical protein [uncultured Tateyamaria sp.]